MGIFDDIGDAISGSFKSGGLGPLVGIDPVLGSSLGGLWGQREGRKKGAAQPWQGEIGSASGTGAGFLSGLAYGGNFLGSDGRHLDPTSGGTYEYNTPHMMASFVRGEMGSGGHLASANQSRQTAAGVRGIAASGMVQQKEMLDTLMGRGLNPAQAAAMMRDKESETVDAARDYMGQERHRISGERYGAMQSLMNMTSQTALAAKAAKANYEAVKRGAKATEKAGMYGAIGSMAGSGLGALAACCFIFLEARYGNGTMDKVVRRFRDEHMTARNKRGYYKLSEVLVPLMRKYRPVKWLVRALMTDPMVSYGKWHYGQGKVGRLFAPITKFWLGLFNFLGGEHQFIRENGEVV